VGTNFFVTFRSMTCRLWTFWRRQRADRRGHSCARVRDGSEPIATFLYGLRYFLGRIFRWDRQPTRPEDSFLECLSERDRRDSEITPGTLDGHFWVFYQFAGETLRETRNRTVHGFSCTALVSCPNGYRLYWGVYVRRVSWLTRPYLPAIELFRAFCIRPCFAAFVARGLLLTPV
jgi:hypothetical protein